MDHATHNNKPTVTLDKVKDRLGGLLEQADELSAYAVPFGIAPGVR